MPKASKADIKFFKGVQLIHIHNQLTKDGTFISLDELEDFLKAYADLDGVSCSKMSHEQMQELKEFTKQFACSIGMGEDYFDKFD